MKRTNACLCLSLVLGFVMTPIGAGELCATDQERDRVHAFFAENPGTLPFTAARRLGIKEARVLAALPPEQAVSAPGSEFEEVWAALSEVTEAVFLISKGSTVFEVLSGVSPGAPSTQSQYFNIDYVAPLRGHLRPDEFTAIYAVDLEIDGGEGDVLGVVFYDGAGEPVFSVFVSGDALTATPENEARFEAVFALIEAKPSVCEAPD